jgi:hypothetical protein
METIGTTSEQFGAIAVAQRAWAGLTPGAAPRSHQTGRPQTFLWPAVAGRPPLRLGDPALLSHRRANSTVPAPVPRTAGEGQTVRGLARFVPSATHSRPRADLGQAPRPTGRFLWGSDSVTGPTCGEQLWKSAEMEHTSELAAWTKQLRSCYGSRRKASSRE